MWSVVCSKHFEKYCFEEKTSGRRDLKKGSYPTLFLCTSDAESLPAAKSVPLDHSYKVPNQKVLKRKLDKATQVLQTYKKRINTLQKSNQRKKLKCQTLLDVIKGLKEKCLISENVFEKLSSDGAKIPFELLQRLQNSKSNEVISRKEYSIELKRFALTLHFYSPKAYNYVRESFLFNLPHEYTIRRWYSSVQSDTGN